MKLVAEVVGYHDLGQPDSYTQVTHNSGNDVFVGEDHVIKFFTGHGEQASARETEVCAALQETLPTPRVVATGHVSDEIPYVVMQKVPGEALELTWKGYSETEQSTLSRQLGALLATTHASADKVADILPPPSHAPMETLRNRAAEALSPLGTQQLLEPSKLAAVKNYLVEHIEDMGSGSYGLRHGGFRFGNVLAEETNITGLLDWEDASLGDTAEELDLTLYRTIPDAHQAAFMEGYAGVLPEASQQENHRLVYPLLYYLKFMPQIPTWTEFPGKQAYYIRETDRILEETIGHENQLHNVA